MCSQVRPARSRNKHDLPALAVHALEERPGQGRFCQCAGTLDEFAFQTINNRMDLHSRLRYFDIGNNSFVGARARGRSSCGAAACCPRTYIARSPDSYAKSGCLPPEYCQYGGPGEAE